MISIFRSTRASRRPRVRFVPTVDGLEGRVVLSTLSHHSAKVHHTAATHHHASKGHHAATTQQVAIVSQVAVASQVAPAQQPVMTTAPIVTTTAPVATSTTVVAPPAQTTTATASLNGQVAAFLTQKLGQRVGSGECADLAVEALRVAGAKFTGIAPDISKPGDYAWGTLVKAYSVQGGQVVDSAPGAAIEPGDVLQFDEATFSNGVTASHHTAVVAAVDSAGRVTQVFQQDVSTNGGPADRTDAVGALDLSGLTGGTVTVYSPVARVATAGTATFTLVNNASTPETVTLDGMVVSLTAADTTGSMMTFTAGGLAQVVVNGQTITASDGGGYQIVGSGASTSLQPVA